MLSNQGFERVYQLQGGLDAWEAPTASGPVALHLQYVKGDETPQRVIGIAYRMEEGLKTFHQEIRSRTPDADLRSLLKQLISAEQSHQQTLLTLMTKVARTGKGEGSEPALLPDSRGSEESYVEGGIDMAAFVRQNEHYLQSLAGYLELTMMVETQALDLYLRMGRESRNPVTREVLLQIGAEEKGHLLMLGRFLENQRRKTAV